MTPTDRYVALDRRFADLGAVDNIEDLATRSYVELVSGRQQGVGWPDIFRDDRSCVILGEAGSGKTREMEQQALELQARGVAAIKADLRDLLRSTTLLDGNSVLRSWRRGNDLAWFFLDSVDEAKLAHVSDFHHALQRMATWAGADLNRARFVISSRISEWRPGTDKRLVEETLLRRAEIVRLDAPSDQRRSSEAATSPARPDARTGSRSAKPQSPDELRVLTLLPLTRQQAEAYLANRGPDVQRFFADVADADAWAFLHRPLDVTNIHALWQKRGKLGTLREVVEDSVAELLADPTHAATLAADIAREGAEFVAAGLTFSKSAAALVPDAVLADATDAVHFRACLPPTWSDADARLLAQRPIFDAPAYGKIRFHHRSYQTYLTASWLARLMRTGCEYAELQHLLFEQGQGQGDRLTLRPSLQAVAAWMACVAANGASWQLALRDDLLRSAPWVFFADGDPRSLPVDYKARVLRSTVEHFNGRDHVQVDWDHATLKRFADPALAEVVGGMVADASLASDLRADYVMLVREGSLVDALPSVVTTALDSSTGDYLRATALACIAKIGNDEQRRRVLSAFESLDEIDVRLGVQVARVAYPRVTDENGLFRLLQRMRVDYGESRTASLFDLDDFVENDTAPSRLLPSLDRLYAFLQDADGNPRQDRAWAAEWLAPLTARVLNTQAVSPPTCRLVVDICALIEVLRERGWFQSCRGDALKALAEATTRHSAVRREWYRRKIAAYRADDRGEPSSLWSLDEHHAPLSQGACDLRWLYEDICSDRPLIDRRFALRAALWLRASRARPQEPLPRVVLFEVLRTSGLRAVLADYLLSASARPWFKLRQEWTWKWSKWHWWRRGAQPMVERYRNLRNRAYLWRRRAELEQGRSWNGSWFVVNAARVKGGASQWGAHDLTIPIRRYGATIVNAAMAGADAIWRSEPSELPHEKSQRHQTTGRTILGLVALQWAWETRGEPYFRALSPDDAKTAARYGLDELNGLPKWYGVLASEYPEIVSSVLSTALNGEWEGVPADNEFGSPTLQRLLYGPEAVARLGMPAVLALLRGAPPANAVVLREALRLGLRGGATARDLIARRAAEEVDGAIGVQPDSPWLVALFLADADRALDVVERRVAELDAADRVAWAVALCSGLGGDHGRALSCTDPDLDRPAFLRRFIPWVYRHIRLSDDVVHASVYSPDARDHAETFRGSLIGRLQASPADDADEVLADLAADPEMAEIRDFLLHRMDQRRSTRADHYVIEPRDLFALLTDHERTPRTAADLFHLAKSRLAAFKERVESAENSIRHERGVHWLESDYQDWLQRHLQSAARGLYTIPSEAKVDPTRFPDLRFEAPAVDGAISVEAKVATFDHWSYPTLEERLLNQLIGQYLRARNARFGVYVLFRADAGRGWRTDDGRPLGWSDLIERLQATASAAITTRADIDSVLVMGIDVTRPQ